MPATGPKAPRGKLPSRWPRHLSEIEHALSERAAEISDELERGIPQTLGHRAADVLLRIGSSWLLVIGFLVWIAGWITVNSLVLAGGVDPYPYIFLNLLFSGLSSILAPIVLISQSRMEQLDRLRATENFRTNLEAELQIAALHEKVDHLGGPKWDELEQLEDAQQEILELLLRRRRGR